MRRFWRLSVVVIVLTLAPMQAWAECAWVLWEERSGLEFHRDGPPAALPREWFISGAIVNPQDCQRAALNAVQQRASQHGGPSKNVRVEGARVSIGGYVTRDIVTYTYQCLPDTVDPRGPKGSGR